MNRDRATLPEQLSAAGNPVATTEVLQAAIDAAVERGGGLVNVPPGEWTIATIFLRSGVRLHLQR